MAELACGPIKEGQKQMGVPELSIRTIRARAVIAPLPRPLRTAVGDILNAPLVLVDVLTNEEITGRGYAFAYTPLTLRALVQFLNDLAPELAGTSVSPRSRMLQLEKRLKLVGWQGFAGMAVGALDMALWDALSCAMELPLAVHLGGEVRPLPAYDSFGILDLHTDLPWLEESIQNGFKAVKIKLGAGDLETDVAVVSEVRRTIGDGVRLMLDFNQSQTTASAVERILRLQEFDLTWVEEPVGADDLLGHRAVRERVRPVAIQTGENWWFPRGMANAIAAGASDLAMVDVMKIGGVTGWISAMGQAEAAALPLSNHTFVEASAHVMSVSPTASWFEYLDIAGAVLTERLLPVDGMVSARGPGLGLTWDEAAVTQYAFT
jgi:mandelate racemase